MTGAPRYLYVYIAGKFDAQWRLRHVRDLILQRTPSQVTSTWLDEDAAADPAPGAAAKHAWRDLEDIASSDLLIVDTIDDNARGGREVEVGFALGHGKPVWVVGPKRNIFHDLAEKHFTGWNDAIAELGWS